MLYISGKDLIGKKPIIIFRRNFSIVFGNSFHLFPISLRFLILIQLNRPLEVAREERQKLLRLYITTKLKDENVKDWVPGDTISHPDGFKLQIRVGTPLVLSLFFLLPP
jgi:hypothetical protein